MRRFPLRHWKSIAVASVLVLFASCKDATAPRVPAGSLRINTSNLPSHLTATFGLTKIGGSTREVTGNTDITGLDVGEYTIATNQVQDGALVWEGQLPAAQVNIVDGQKAEVTATYATRPGTISVVISGLPAAAVANVELTGPDGQKVQVTSSKQISNAKPGTWQLNANPTEANGFAFTPTTAQLQLSLTSGVTKTFNVQYLVSNGALTVSVLGLPGGTPASVTVTGPNNYTKQVSSTTTITGLTPGVYNVAPSPVTAESGMPYETSNPFQVNVVASTSPANAQVTYTPGLDDMSVAFAYVTQATQRQDGTVPLVANRTALLRVFVTNNRPGAASPEVRARIYDGANLVETLTLTRSGVLPLAVNQGSAASSYNAVLPAALVKPGLRVLMDVDPNETANDFDRSDNVWPRSGNPAGVNVVSVPPLHIHFVPVKVGNLTGNISVQNAEQYLNALRLMFPVNEITYTFNEAFTSTVAQLPAGDAGFAPWESVLIEINAMRNGSQPPAAHYIGIVKVNYFNNGIAGIAYVSGRAAVVWDHLPSGSEVTAHELGHNFGRQHVLCSGNEAGVDFNYPYPGGVTGVFGWNSASGAIVSPQTTDIMSYCNSQWISDYTWTASMNFRQVAGAQAMQSTQGDGIMVWGRVSRGSISLNPAFRTTATFTMADAAPTHTVELLDSRGTVLSQLNIRPLDIDHIEGEQHFAVVLPWSAQLERDLATIRVRDLRVPVLAASRSSAAAISRTNPAAPVQLEEPNEQLSPAGGNMASLRWNQADFPMVMVKDVASGQVIAFLREPGQQFVRRAGRAVELTFSDGVRSVVRRR